MVPSEFQAKAHDVEKRQRSRHSGARLSPRNEGTLAAIGNDNVGRVLRRRISGDLGRNGTKLDERLARAIGESRGGGRTLPQYSRRQMEQALGHDLSSVRIHTDERAAEFSETLHARAFTIGNDVYFSRGSFQPGSRQGLRLLAHELTHVVQQSALRAATPARVSDPHEESEQEADRVAESIIPRHGNDWRRQEEKIGLAPQISRAELHDHTTHGVGIYRFFEGSDHAKTRGRELEQRVEELMVDNRALRTWLNATIEHGIDAVDSIRENLAIVGGHYRDAYSTFEETLESSKARAEAAEAYADAVIGVFIGVGVGLSVGALIPLAAGASIAAKASVGAIQSVSEWLVGQGLKELGDVGRGPDQPSPGGSFDHGDPAVREVRVYKRLARLYRLLALLGTRIAPLADVAYAAAAVRPDCREFRVSGAHSAMTIEELAGLVTAIETMAINARDVALHIGALELGENLSQAREEARSQAKDVDRFQMERHIWIHWMASLSRHDAEQLDDKVIESRLFRMRIYGNSFEDFWGGHGGRYSVIGWNPGRYHSDAESVQGTIIAARYSRALRLIGTVGRIQDAEFSDDPLRTYGKFYPPGQNISHPDMPPYSVMLGARVKEGDEIVITDVRTYPRDRSDPRPGLVAHPLHVDAPRSQDPPWPYSSFDRSRNIRDFVL